MDYLKVRAERRKRDGRRRALELYEHAGIIAYTFGDHKEDKELYDFFPQYWDEEEREKLIEQRMLEDLKKALRMSGKKKQEKRQEETENV